MILGALDGSWTDIKTATGVSGSYILHNSSTETIYLIRAASAPNMSMVFHENRGGLALRPGASTLVVDDSETMWAMGMGAFAVEPASSSSVGSFVFVDLPPDAWTGSGEHRRLRVDSAQTSFFTGEQGRVVREFEIPSGRFFAIRVVAPIDAVFYDVSVTLASGAIRLDTRDGGVEHQDAVWGTQDVRLKNSMASRSTPYYQPQITMFASQYMTDRPVDESGGLIDVIKVKTAGATSSKQTIGSSPFSERGIPAGTYYWVFENTSNELASGVFYSWWEERP